MNFDNNASEEASSYFKGEIGNKDCESQGGLNIRDNDECIMACNELGIVILSNKMRSNGLCYVGSDNKCRRNRNSGNQASRICAKNGANT